MTCGETLYNSHCGHNHFTYFPQLHRSTPIIAYSKTLLLFLQTYYHLLVQQSILKLAKNLTEIILFVVAVLNTN